LSTPPDERIRSLASGIDVQKLGVQAKTAAKKPTSL